MNLIEFLLLGSCQMLILALAVPEAGVILFIVISPVNCQSAEPGVGLPARSAFLLLPSERGTWPLGEGEDG